LPPLPPSMPPSRSRVSPSANSRNKGGVQLHDLPGAAPGGLLASTTTDDVAVECLALPFS
jgi:hypothetical protein